MVSGESSVQRHAVDLTLTETPGRQAPVRQHQRPATARPPWGMTESRRPLAEPPVLPVDPEVQDVFARTPGRRTRPPTARPPAGRRHHQRRLRARPAARDRNRGVAAHDVRPVGPGYRLPRRLHHLLFGGHHHRPARRPWCRGHHSLAPRAEYGGRTCRCVARPGDRGEPWRRTGVVAAHSEVRPGRSGDRASGGQMALTGAAQRLTIFIGESDQWHHRPLYAEIVRRAHQSGMAGASVLRGIEGFGPSSHIHTARLLSLSQDLPIAIIIVDSAERIRGFLPELDVLVTDGALVILDDVEVIKYVGRWQASR